MLIIKNQYIRFVLLLLILITFGSSKLQQNVYVCENGRTEVYHGYQCRGLSRCTHSVSTITVSQAQNRGLRPCKFCY